MIVFRSAVLVITGQKAVRKHTAALFRREKLVLLQVRLTGHHLVFAFLHGKSLELAALVTLLARLPVNYPINYHDRLTMLMIVGDQRQCKKEQAGGS